MDKKHYDFLVVGCGIFGAVFVHEAIKKGKTCLIIERRNHIGGNVYTELIDGINVHKYGPHIFHTSKKHIWNYVNTITPFNNYINEPLAFYRGKYYNLPFNMNTFFQLWGVTNKSDAQSILSVQTIMPKSGVPANLEEQALMMVGQDIYNILIKGYTEKQWGRPCNELPADIIKRIPIRFTYNNNYFDDTYQGIPAMGYTVLIEKLIEGADIVLNKDFIANKGDYLKVADVTVYTGSIDEFFDYRLGNLEYRSLRFEEEKVTMRKFQRSAVINYTDSTIPYTRIVEHKLFDSHCKTKSSTIITREYSAPFTKNTEPYYPVNSERNNELYRQYVELAKTYPNVYFKGRLGSYKYYNMDRVVEEALAFANEIIE